MSYIIYELSDDLKTAKVVFRIPVPVETETKLAIIGQVVTKEIEVTEWVRFSKIGLTAQEKINEISARYDKLKSEIPQTIATKLELVGIEGGKE